MKRTNRVTWLCLCLTIVFSISRCKSDSNDQRPGIVPGSGITINGETLSLGDSKNTLNSVFGAPDIERDLGNLGHNFSYLSLQVSGFFSEPEQGSKVIALYLHPGFEGFTAGGVGIGSNESAVKAEFGEPVQGCFLKAWWFNDKGICFTLENSKVSKIYLFNPHTESTSSTSFFVEAGS
ncbi:hypothetical protein ACFL27_25415 [candidate division CSSED10-310 bacterium]|uniref:Lipoprotein n=1 Tax=candidate division CSSED10-310 bacterium TaxID=2855610 RepID=A0ABV6Z517_UNCC1